MKKIPDRVTMDKSALDMDHVIPTDEMGELRYIDLDVPPCDPEYFRGVFLHYLKEFSYTHWSLLEVDLMDKHMKHVLFQMCVELVDIFRELVLKQVAPQVLARVQAQISPDDPSTSTETRFTRNYHRVKANDMEASLGDFFHFGFGEVLHIKQKRSHLSEQLTELFALEVQKEVNCSLALIGGPDSLREAGEPAPQSKRDEYQIKMMVVVVAGILSELLNDYKNQGSKNTDSSEHSCLEEATSLEDDDSEVDATEFSASCVEELTQQEKTFLAVFLAKLVELIADSTKTSVFDVDFGGVLKRLREKTAGESKSTLPQTVGNIHILIFKKLCREFGSAKLLQSAMVSSDMAFEEAVAEFLKAQLEKSVGETCSVLKKVRLFGKRTNNVTPACEVLEESVPHSKIMDKDNGSTPPPERKLPQREKTFLDVFLVELVELIADSTKTSIFEVDFEGMMARLREKTAGELKSTLPQTVGNIPILIFKELCQEFGSAKLLQSAMVSSDWAFEEAVAEFLKAQLEKSGGETCSVVRKARFFGKRTNKVTPACEVLEESVPHSKIMDKDNGSTPPPERKLPQREKTFLDVFLVELVELIADSTKTSIFEVDFEGMMARLREKTAGELKSTLPQTVGNIPILIFKELCQEFGSAKLLQSAMVSSDMAFEEAVAKFLKAQLEKSEGETSVRGFSGKKTSKSCSGCEVLNKENGSTPPPERKKKRPAIIRMLSSMARILRRPFTCCSSSGSLDD